MGYSKQLNSISGITIFFVATIMVLGGISFAIPGSPLSINEAEASHTPTFSTPNQLTNILSPLILEFDGQKMAVSGNNVIIVWTERSATSLGGTELRTLEFVSSSDNGATFPFSGTIAATTVSTTRISNIDVAASGSDFYVTWDERDTSVAGDPSDLFFRKISNTGVQSAVQPLFSHNERLFDLQIDAEGNFIHMIFRIEDGVGADGDVVYIRSTDGGTTFKGF